MEREQAERIQRCEDGLAGARRLCPCHGALHGRKGGDVYDLPLTDAHSVAEPCDRCKATGWIIVRNFGEEWKSQCPDCDGHRVLFPQADVEQGTQPELGGGVLVEFPGR